MYMLFFPPSEFLLTILVQHADLSQRIGGMYSGVDQLMPLSSKTVRIAVLAGLPKFTSNRLKVGQMEAAKAWNRCRDAQQSAIEERTKWPHRDMLHQRMSQWEYGKDIEYLD